MKDGNKIFTVVWWGKKKRLTKDFNTRQGAIKFIIKLANENDGRHLGIRYIEYIFSEEDNDYVIYFDTMEKIIKE